MSIDALLQGRLMAAPTQRTSRNGNPFTTCRLRVSGAAAGNGDAADDSLLVSCIAFDERAQAALMSLDVGEAIAVAGALKAGVWTANDGATKPSLDMTVGAVLSAYSVSKRRKAAQPDQEGRHQDQRPSDAAWRAAAPADRGPRQHRPADGLDDGAPLDF